MIYRYTILYVDDVPDTMARFEQALGLERHMLHDSGTYGELATGETRLAFSARSLMKQLGKDPGRAEAKRPVFEVAFEVPADEVTAAYQRALDGGFTDVQPPRTEPWGQTTAYVADPKEGFLIELCSPVAPPPQT